MSTQKIKSVIIEENGGSEKFKVVENEIGTPGKGEILIRHKLSIQLMIEIVLLKQNFQLVIDTILFVEE